MKINRWAPWLPLIILASTFSCAPVRVWTSTPTVQVVDNAVYSARFEPLMWGTDGAFLNAFRLSIKNKTEADLEIDWTSTLYLVNGQPHGRFIWAGIGKENVNSPPPDFVSPGQSFSRIVIPLRMIAWKPLDSASNKESFSAGPLPEGRNSIDLIVSQDNQQVRARLTVDIRVK